VQRLQADAIRLGLFNVGAVPPIREPARSAGTAAFVQNEGATGRSLHMFLTSDAQPAGAASHARLRAS
jgi:hypothetical protein